MLMCLKATFLWWQVAHSDNEYSKFRDKKTI